MQKADFFAALKKSVDIEERYDLQFEKVLHDVKKGIFFIRFCSNFLPASHYLAIEEYVKDVVGASARVIVAYRDLGSIDDTQIEMHVKEMCCRIKPSLAPFAVQSQMRFDGDVFHIDFADDFDREIFDASGVKEYLCGYFGRCFGRDVTIRLGRHHDGVKKGESLSDADRRMLEQALAPQNKQEPAKSAPPKPEAPKKAPKKAAAKKSAKERPQGVIHGKSVVGAVERIKDIDETTGLCVAVGNVLSVKYFDIKNEARGKKSIVIFSVTDYTSTITCKAFVAQTKRDSIIERLKSAGAVKVMGKAAYDSYSREVCVMANGIEETQALRRTDNADIKRVELHMHTNMSALDGVADEKDAVAAAAAFGHEAVAITDHGVVQAFPRAFDASKKLGIKVIYGMEAYMIDDTGDTYREEFEDEYVVFDLETTGLNANTCGITEIGAVRLRGGQIVDEFSTFVDPEMRISQQITDTTGITNEMVKGAPKAGQALAMFKEYIGDAHLAAHNAPFDLSFIKRHGDENGISFDNKCLDTIPLFRRTLPGHKSYSLGRLAADLGITFTHHRALNDAQATAKIMVMSMDEAKRSARSKTQMDEKNLKSFHVILLCKNAQGLFNLYKLVSESHMNHFYRRPRVPKSLLKQYREGLIVGSACEAGELIQAMLRFAPDGEIERIAQFYDYLEVQPDGNNAFMIRKGQLRNIEAVRDITRRIVALGEKLDKPVAATCDAHFLEPEDEVFRRILMHGQGFTDADDQAPLFFRTTDEMLGEFTYLGDEKAREIVVDNTRAIAAQVDNIQLLPDDPAMPDIPGAAEKLEAMAYENARALYGDELPAIVEERLAYELGSIIKHGYGVLYFIAYELVKHSLEDGYLVGSRGSVGSSFAATMSGITEVNPLPPHYVCPNCRHSDFNVDTEQYASGPDLPEADCPKCGTAYRREGFDIPFAVFLGINADKVPDIDLNFSGVYQPEAHKFTVEYFGEDYVFRAGTISSIADRTAYGFVKAYADEKGMNVPRAEIDRLVSGVAGTKRTTGQHPGGLVILPKNRDIHEFTPIQRPANDMKSTSVTTHYNFGSLHDRLIKLDILGHDDPTALRMLQDLTGIAPTDVPIDDPDTLSLFSSTKALGLSPEQILGCKVGSLGIPEFGTKFVRQMLLDTMPTTIAELIRISGLSHGTDVWINNAHDLIKAGTATLRDVICTRDDIMNYLISRGMDATESFYIMESVRKGKGLKDEQEAAMKAAGVPAWFIDSCKKIKYMFPKAHAVAYVTMALRIAYFKVHHPRAFYATYFTVRADNLDAAHLHSGEMIRRRIADISAKGKAASAQEHSQMVILEAALEMSERGIDFLPCDLYKSDATDCIIEDGGIRLPFTALGGTGASAARGIVDARKKGEFLSVEDLKTRAGISSAVIGQLDENGCLEGLMPSNQLSLFD